MEDEKVNKKEELIKVVRERVGDKFVSPRRHDDRCIARFLSATNNDVDVAVKNIEDWLVHKSPHNATKYNAIQRTTTQRANINAGLGVE